MKFCFLWWCLAGHLYGRRNHVAALHPMAGRTVRHSGRRDVCAIILAMAGIPTALVENTAQMDD
jgi:hypothetical protein